jgi:putative transposase
MRELPTRYAVYFNRRHDRAGHLFQNRSTSPSSEKKILTFYNWSGTSTSTLLEAGIVKRLDGLDSYPWTGHSAIIGKRVREWQNRACVLGTFSTDPEKAITLYRAFMGESRDSPDFEGSGLLRSHGDVLSRRDGLSTHDARVLGSSDFVPQIRTESEKRGPSVINADEVVAEICRDLGLTHERLLNGSRTKAAAKARLRIIEDLVTKSGVEGCPSHRHLALRCG